MDTSRVHYAETNALKGEVVYYMDANAMPGCVYFVDTKAMPGCVYYLDTDAMPGCVY